MTLYKFRWSLGYESGVAFVVAESLDEADAKVWRRFRSEPQARVQFDEEIGLGEVAIVTTWTLGYRPG